MILERRCGDGGWSPVWEYERGEEASRAVDTRVAAHDGSAADYRVRPIQRRPWIQRTILAACIGVIIAVCLTALVVALIR